MGCVDLAQDMDKGRALLNAVMNIPRSTKCGEYLDQLMDCYPVKRPLLPAVSYDPFSNAHSSSDYGPYMIEDGEDMEGKGRELL